MRTVEQLQQQSVRAKELGHAMTLISVEELDMLIGAKIAYQDAHELRTLLGTEQRSNESLIAVARAAKKLVEDVRLPNRIWVNDLLKALPASVKAKLERVK